MSGFPTDWPRPSGSGGSATPAVDLAVHDLPHRSSSTEWWYLNSHFVTTTGRRLSLFAAFFRIIKGQDEKTKAPTYAHSLTWALSDADEGRYHPESRVDESAPKMGLERIAKGRGSRDPRLNRAMSEILERGKVPSPDRTFDGDIFVASDRLELDFAGARFTKLDNGDYRLQLSDEKKGIGCDLTFSPRCQPVRHGDDGVVRGHGGEQMFYYFIPRCELSGAVTLQGAELPIAHGTGWYDHEFGGAMVGDTQNEPPAARVDLAWNWTAVQLDDGSAVSAYCLFRTNDNQLVYQWAIVIDKEGRTKSYKEFTFAPEENWRSMRTFYDYPVRWHLALPEAAIDLHINASFADQEFMTAISKPAFWEGRCEVAGTIGAQNIAGLGYIERSGFEPVKDLDEFFAAVGQEVRKSVAAVVPLEPTFVQLRNLLTTCERDHYLQDVDTKQLARALIKPIREIADRGGKSWRSYAALACCDVVGGDSRKFVQWLAMPELMHVGSLIVDDVQDKSTVRRGGPACHLVHGEPLAINAGTAAYFITQRLLITKELSDAKKLRLYDLYFEVMSAGHAGQALDLDGLWQFMPEEVEGGGDSLEARVLAIHRLKAAVPAGSLARMGAIAGGGSEAQIEAVGHFFESLGLAFQIVDDVLNLRGFKGDLKKRGEDIANGTITLPIANAMSRLPLEERRWLAARLAEKTNDLRVISSVVEKLETCGALNACALQAQQLVDDAWAKAAPLLADSMYKVMLRAFGWYVLERHY